MQARQMEASDSGDLGEHLVAEAEAPDWWKSLRVGTHSFWLPGHLICDQSSLWGRTST
jgi:hypothetical protein